MQALPASGLRGEWHSPIPALTSNLAVWRSDSCRKRQGKRFVPVVKHPVEYLPYCLGLRASQYFRHQFHWFLLSLELLNLTVYKSVKVSIGFRVLGVIDNQLKLKVIIFNPMKERR